jgi:hypothetical protein
MSLNPKMNVQPSDSTRTVTHPQTSTSTLSEEPPRCHDCGNSRNNMIYIPGQGYITYCSRSCFRDTL